MPIIYKHQPDEVVPQPAPLRIDDDGSGWWAGTQRCFASVALATVISAGTLSTALAQKVQQQTEDVVPRAASFVAHEDYWINPSPPLATVNFVSRPYAFDEGEVVPPAVPPFVPDEDFWPTLLTPAEQPPATLLSRQPFASDVHDFALLPSSQIDEDYWIPSRAFQTVAYQWLIAQDQADVVSPPQVFHPDEDYWTPAPAVQRLCYLLLPVAQDQAEFDSAPAGSVVDEDYWPLLAVAPQWFTMNFQSVNICLRTENYQEGIAILSPARGVGLQWLRCHGHGRGLFSRRR